MKKALFLFVISLPCWNLADAAMPDPAGTVFIGTTGDPLRGRISVGFVADETGHIITYMSSPPENLFVFNNINDGTSHRAHKMAYDEISKLVLLQLDGSTENFKPYKFALESAELQRKVYGINLENEPDTRVVTGALASIEEAESDQHPNYYLHNALVGKKNLGGALFNNCGEVVGVIVPKPGWFNRTPKGTQYAVPVDWAINKFSTQEWQITRVTDVCLSDAKQAAEKVRLATEAKQVAAAAKEAMEQEAAKKQAELDALKQKSEEEKGASEEERQRLKADIETRKKEAREASDQVTAAQEAHAAAKDAEKEAKEAKEALAEAQDATREREEQYMLWAILGGAVLLFLLLLVWMLKQRTVTRERREKEAAASRAEEVQASLTAREEEDARVRQTPTVFFEGTDSNGKNFALRIPGPSIATASGAAVGRNPGGSDFILNHPQVSRRQFRLFVDGKLLLIEDLNSTNGTIVDGKKLSGGDETVVTNLSRVELSDLVLTVRLEYNQPAPNSPENNNGS